MGRLTKKLFKGDSLLENGRHGLGFAKNYNQLSLNELLAKLTYPTSERQWVMYEALRKGATVEQLSQLTKIRPLFIEMMKELVVFEGNCFGIKAHCHRMKC